MSFQIKDKKKITLLRKSVITLTQNTNDLSIHFTKTEVSAKTACANLIALFRFVSLLKMKTVRRICAILQRRGSVSSSRQSVS